MKQGHLFDINLQVCACRNVGQEWDVYIIKSIGQSCCYFSYLSYEVEYYIEVLLQWEQTVQNEFKQLGNYFRGKSSLRATNCYCEVVQCQASGVNDTRYPVNEERKRNYSYVFLTGLNKFKTLIAFQKNLSMYDTQKITEKLLTCGKL